MATERLLDCDHLTGISTYHSFENGKRTLRTVQDIDAILDDNKSGQYNAKGRATERGRIGFRVASIPIMVQYKWLHEEGWDCMSNDPGCQKKLRQKLNDPEWRHLRRAELVV